MQSTAKLRAARISAQKARLVADQNRGMINKVSYLLKVEKVK